MMGKLLYYFLLVMVMMPVCVHAQDDDFCEAVNAILHDAPNQFRNVRTNITQTSFGAATYKSGINVPGTISSRFVSSMGLFYEGAVCQSNSLDSMKPFYEQYKQKLNQCLAGKGYTMFLIDNFYEGLADFKKVSYMQPCDKNTDPRKLKGHITLEMDHNKTSGLYTLIFYIYEH